VNTWVEFDANVKRPARSRHRIRSAGTVGIELLTPTQLEPCLAVDA